VNSFNKEWQRGDGVVEGPRQGITGMQVTQRVEDVHQFGVKPPFRLQLWLVRATESRLHQAQPLQGVDAVTRDLERQQRIVLLQEDQSLLDDQLPIREAQAADLVCIEKLWKGHGGHRFVARLGHVDLLRTHLFEGLRWMRGPDLPVGLMRSGRRTRLDTSGSPEGSGGTVTGDEPRRASRRRHGLRRDRVAVAARRGRNGGPVLHPRFWGHGKTIYERGRGVLHVRV
jgi:hypothetical protein